PEALRVLARAQAAVGRVDEAVTSYRLALIADDRDVWSLNNLGMLYVEIGDPDAALGPLARAVQLKGTSPVFLNNLGVALELDGYPVTARDLFAEAVRSDSTYTKAVKNLERMKALVPDSAVVEGLSIKKVADLFRLEVEMWKESTLVQDSVR